MTTKIKTVNCLPFKDRLSMQKSHSKQLSELLTNYEKLKENARKTYEGAARKTR